MGRRGPAPKPSHLRILEGTDRRGHAGRRLDRSREPVAPDGELEPPYKLSAEVQQVWDQTVADLEAMGIGSPADCSVLVAYCEAVVVHRIASRLLAETSILVLGSRGTLIINKALLVQREAAYQVLRLAQEFGLTPAARMRVEVDPVRGYGSGKATGARKPNPFAG